MSKYTNDVAEALLERVDIVDLIGRYVQLKQTGRNHKGLCPFHNEKTPSFIVSEDKQLYHCFGCGAGGNAIGFYMAIESLDFIDAVEALAERYGLDLDRYRTQNSVQEQETASLKKTLYQINREAAVFYLKKLKEDPVAQAYLKRRGIDALTARRFGLGFAPDAWQPLTDHFDPRQIPDLLKVGLVDQRKNGNGYYDKFRNRLIFPIQDQRQNIIGFGGRAIGDEMPKYLNSPESVIFSKGTAFYGILQAKEALSKLRSVIIVEGYMDVIMLHQAGISNVVATLGTAMTEAHARVLDRYVDEVTLCFDGDEAGRKAALRGVSLLKGMKAKLKVLTLPVGQDPDDFVRMNGAEAFRKLVQDAVSSTAFLIQAAKYKYNLNAPNEKLEYLKNAAMIIRGLDSDVEKSYYIDYVAKDQSYDVNAIYREVYGHSKSRPSYENKKQFEKVAIDTTHYNAMLELEKKMLEIAIRGKTAFELVCSELDLEQLTNKEFKALFKCLELYYRVYDAVAHEDVAEMFDVETAVRFDQLARQSIVNDNLAREAMVTRIHYKLAKLDAQIEALRAEREKLEEPREKALSQAEVTQLKLVLIRKEMELKKMKAEAVKERDSLRGGTSIG
ncbi:DNA primase [Acidaminobacter hydrogenoformans]|uniref:DNA primase n=1 Tax=Acidaminobacter hydrogenoformans DSM 2784 TaxID=1120920 RepID=A0A1G5RSS6_9FIRM|nr:DNA primase [Acidaminobacter hydrogenoformans]SCZ77144.1 DNA primase [Acidaminobacter hydrogenoformans DSM 2784]